MDFKVGDKVIPVSNSIGTCPLELSSQWKKARRNNQNFLYVINYFLPDKIYVCTYEKPSSILNEFGGDYFFENDLRPIREEAFLEIFKEEIYG